MEKAIRKATCGVISNKKKASLRTRVKKDLQENWIRYVMLLPVIAYFVIFKYIPMYGITLAFKDFNYKAGILGSPWVGFENFRRFFDAYNFESLIRNTLRLSLYSLLVSFPIPIVFALFLNYLKNDRLRKAVQTVSYAPHFISTVVICGMLSLFMSNPNGVFNLVRGFFGAEPIAFLSKPELFSHIYVWSGVWQGMGWSAIIYISALAGVDQQMHEAAIIDGATKLQRMWHIDIPSIKSTIVMLLILKMGSIMNLGFEKVYLLQNPLNKEVSNILSTYVYQVGIQQASYSYSTAVDLFNTVVNVILLVVANTISKKLLHESLI